MGCQTITLKLPEYKQRRLVHYDGALALGRLVLRNSHRRVHLLLHGCQDSLAQVSFDTSAALAHADTHVSWQDTCLAAHLIMHSFQQQHWRLFPQCERAVSLKKMHGS